MSAQAFARGLIAELVVLGRTNIEPQAAPDRAGFFRALDAVTEYAESVHQDDQQRDLYRDAIRIRNALKPSNNGAFDGLERLLRSQQLSLTASPNPFYEQIALSISRAYAESLLSELAPEHREIIRKAASAFIGAAA